MSLDPDALFVALVLAPDTYSRNRFFRLFERPELGRARRRAQLVRSLVKDLTEPWPHPGAAAPKAPAVDVRVVDHGEGVELSYRLVEFDYRRTALLSLIEVAALRYAVGRAKGQPIAETDRHAVEGALARMDPSTSPARG